MTWDADPLDLFYGVEDAFPIVPDSSPQVRCSPPDSIEHTPTRVAGVFEVAGSDGQYCFPTRTLQVDRSIGWLEACMYLTKSNYSDLSLAAVDGDDNPYWPSDGARLGITRPENYCKYRGYYIKVYGDSGSLAAVRGELGLVASLEEVILGIEAARQAAAVLACCVRLRPRGQRPTGRGVTSLKNSGQ